MALTSVTQGTIERLTVDIIDRSGSVTDLSGSGPKFDVMDEADVFKFGDGTYANGEAATANLMQISCIVDTTDGGIWDEGDYRLFVWFVVGAETVRKGPFEFALVE